MKSDSKKDVNGKEDKLTHAGLYGIGCSMGTLEGIYDVDLNYYVRINFSGFQKIIDKLGGVDVNSQYAFTSMTEEGTYEFSKGKNHLTGEEALGLQDPETLQMVTDSVERTRCRLSRLL